MAYAKRTFTTCMNFNLELRHAEAYLQPSRTSTMELFCKNNQRLLAVISFYKKNPHRRRLTGSKYTFCYMTMGLS